MTEAAIYLPDLLLAYTAYLVAAVTPGPASLAIAAAAMSGGRRAGVAMASGVLMGTLSWGLLAAFGLSAFLLAYGEVTIVLRVAGGLYLLWLAFKSFRSALSGAALPPAPVDDVRRNRRYVARGLAIHMTNPKAVFAWIAIIAIGVGPGAPSWVSFLIVAGCFVLGVAVFGAIALLFSTRRMMGAYGAARRWIDGLAGAVFAAAGVKLLTART